MRQKRAKDYKKQMIVYQHTFKFREAYQTIIDDETVLLCQKSKYNLEKMLNKTVDGLTKPMITQCCMVPIYKSGIKPAIDFAKSFERRKCNHKEAINPSECIKSVVDINGVNKHRYIVVSQDYKLRKQLRKIPGVPLIFMNRSVMVMEPLSEASAKFSEQVENAKLTQGLNDARYAGRTKPEEKDPSDEEKKTTKKRKGPKEPNPLSVKKAKKNNENTDNRENAEGDEKKKRRRRHHGKTEIKENESITENENVSQELSLDKEEALASANDNI